MRHDYKTMDEAWESYMHQCLPDDAPPAQIIGTMGGFFAGAVVALNLIMARFPHDIRDDATAAACASVLREIQAGHVRCVTMMRES